MPSMHRTRKQPTTRTRFGVAPKRQSSTSRFTRGQAGHARFSRGQAPSRPPFQIAFPMSQRSRGTSRMPFKRSKPPTRGSKVTAMVQKLPGKSMLALGGLVAGVAAARKARQSQGHEHETAGRQAPSTP